MKKFRKISFCFLIIVIIILSITLYANVSKGNQKENNEKEISEIDFLEDKIVDLLNEMNNIETRNYHISVSNVSKQTKNQGSSDNNTKQDSQANSASTPESVSSSGEEGGHGSSNNQSTSNTSGGSASSNNNSNSNQGKKFNLESEGVLVNSEKIDWTNVKTEVETLYSSIPTITLDLYKLDIAKEDILGFNKEFDNLTIVVNQNKKEETLNQLSKLYDYIPKFIENTTKDEVKKVTIETKANIFKAYSKLDSKDWTQISKDVKQAVDVYSKLLSNTNIDSNKQYIISKTYVMINELQNAVEVKDEAVFLIKYKNILEEIDNL